jgi:hypothetical protein
MAGMATNRLALLTVPLATASLALAACGGGGGADPASAGDQRSEMREAALDFAKCMREHGVDMPDPTADGGIALRVGPDTGNDPTTTRKAEEACRKHLEKIKPPELSEEQQREFRDRALKFARCMREQGIDMPDPTFGSDGRVTQEFRGRINPDDPRFREANEACSKHQPRMQMQEDAPE